MDSAINELLLLDVSINGCEKVQAKSGILIISYPLLHYDRLNVFFLALDRLCVTDLVVPGIEPRGFEIGLPGSVLHLKNKKKTILYHGLDWSS